MRPILAYYATVKIRPILAYYAMVRILIATSLPFTNILISLIAIALVRRYKLPEVRPILEYHPTYE